MSPTNETQRIAYDLADALEAMGLKQNEGEGYMGQDETHKMHPHVITFSDEEGLKGTILNFSPKFIGVRWVAKGLENIHPKGSVQTEGTDNTVEFIRLAFIEQVDHEELGHLVQ